MKSIFIDTSYVIALINSNDQYHKKAYDLSINFDGYPLVTTDCILLEISNSLVNKYKQESINIINHFQSSKEIEIIHLNPILFQKGFELYQSYQDKLWGLVDCISFIVMHEMDIYDVLTFDSHFEQAGFNILNIA